MTTSYSVVAGDEHSCTIQDNKTPKVAGVPEFLPVWTYMLTENLVAGLSNELYENSSILQIKPNPSHDFVTLELTEENYCIELFDQKGKCVIEHKSATGKTLINLSGLDSGLYFIRVSGERKILTGKVMKL